MDDSYIPASHEEWFEWLSSEDDKTTKSYLAKPAALIGSYRNEIATTRDYEGREILELLQNAADQAREANVRGRVAIELLPDGLVIANDGLPFSIGGVHSLQNAYLSPKRHKRRQYIGNKGLGFRSILNWTQSPIILSGSLFLVYSKTVLQRKLDELTKRNQELASLVNEEKGEADTLVMPILPFPVYGQPESEEVFNGNPQGQRLFDASQRLRAEGYSTVIGMPFEDLTFFEAAEEQIKALRPEILLFVDHLDEVRFNVPGEAERVWMLDGDDSAAMIIENHEALGIWQVHRTDGEVPNEFLDKYQESPLNFELIVAVPEVETIEELTTSTLFSYFPTAVSMPLPVVCHATLELDQSRNHIQQRRSNRYVLERLAEFLAEVAEKRSIQHASGSNAGFRTLIPLEPFSFDLKREGFLECLLEAAKKKEIVPILDGGVATAENALALPGADTSWLPRDTFCDVVSASSAEELQFFHSLGVKELEPKELKRRLLESEIYSQKLRADLIAGLIENNTPEEAHSSALLCGPNGQHLPDNAAVFIAPHGGSIPVLPEWVTLWFLDDSLRKELTKRLGVKDVRELQSKLSTFGLLEYSFARLISRLVASSNQRKKLDPDSSEKIEKELLQTIFSLYRAEGRSGSRPIFPERTSLLIPTQAGEYRSATTLYMGSGYGSQGQIVQSLYGNWSPERLAVEPESLGLDAENSEVPEFLEWLGVAVWPREEKLSVPDYEYLGYVLDRIRYPVRFGQDYIFDSIGQVEGARVQDVVSVDGLDNILLHAEAVAVTAWLSLDGRIPVWTRNRRENAKLSAIKAYGQNQRKYQGVLPSYLRWKLESTAWLPDKAKNMLRPKDCVLGERAIEALFPRPARPNRDALNIYGIEERDLIEGWRRAGVLTSLAELELNDIYSRLFELPERQPDGKSARSLYRWLLDSVDTALDDGGAAGLRFFTHGVMWGRKGDEEGYFPVTELRHADSEGLPPALLNRLKIVDLPHRVGAEKVRRVFGVVPIERLSIKQRVKGFHLAADLDFEFQKAKPFFFLLRESQSSQTQHLGTLKRLNLKVCSELTAEMEYEGEKFDFELPVWGWLIEEDVLYIRADPTEIVDASSDLLADTIGVAIASVFRIGDGGPFARMFLCNQKDRATLLKRMRGEAAVEDMERIIDEFGQTTLKDRISMLPEMLTIQEPEPHEPGIDVELPGLNEEVTEGTPEEKTEIDEDHDVPEELSIEQVDFHPKTGPARRKLRVQKKSSKHNEHITTPRVTDPDFVERKVMEIETTFQPPRYPLRVGQLTGSNAPGCDILSFGSAEQRDRFRSGEDRDLSQVKRFIEVKGRNNEGAEIELRGNEKDAAVNYGDRYYLYRLFKSGENTYTLSILRDPLANDEALEASVYVYLNRAAGTEEYEISGGMLPS